MNVFQNCRVAAANVDPEEYSRTDEKRGSLAYPMSRSELLSLSACPARWRAGYIRPESKALANGNLIDVLLLQADKFVDRYVECPATYETTGMRCPVCLSVTDSKTCRSCKCDREPVKITKEWDWKSTHCQEWKEANKGREPVKAEAMAEARTAVQTVMADPVIADMLANAQTQLMVVGEYADKATGLVVPVKALLDIVPSSSGQFSKWLLDFKTSRSAAMHAWTRDCFNYGYACQAAFHSALYCAATGEDRCTWGHIIQENVAPYHVEKRILSVEFVELGRNQYLSALALYCQCLSKNVWPGYYAQTTIDGFDLVQPDAYMLAASDSRPLEAPEEPTTETLAHSEDIIP